MEIRAIQKTTRQTPRKVRAVANAVRKLPILQAVKQLGAMDRRASLLVMKVLRQALANAQHNHNLKLDQLKIQNILVTEGPRYKRYQAVSRGRAHNIIKRTCNVEVILQKVEQNPVEKKAAKVKTPSAIKQTAKKPIKNKTKVSKKKTK